MGAGVIPFSVRNGEMVFLLHQTFSGRRAGFLVDFGGGGHDGESHRDTAIREFVEETDTMYLADDVTRARRTPERVRAQLPVAAALFERTLGPHPDWWCRRAPGSKIPPKDWRTFFIEVDYREVEVINAQWAADDGGRFKKPRHLLWLSADALLAIYAQTPQRLWKRLRQLIGAPRVIGEIVAEKQPGISSG